MSFAETIFLFVLALLVFGPKKLPEIARQVGRALNEFRRASNEFKAQIEQEIAHLETESKPQILPPSPAVSGALNRATAGDAHETAAVEQPAAVPTSESTAAPDLGPQTSGAPVPQTSQQAPTSEAPAQATPSSDPVSVPASQESHA